MHNYITIMHMAINYVYTYYICSHIQPHEAIAHMYNDPNNHVIQFQVVYFEPHDDDLQSCTNILKIQQSI